MYYYCDKKRHYKIHYLYNKKEDSEKEDQGDSALQMNDNTYLSSKSDDNSIDKEGMMYLLARPKDSDNESSLKLSDNKDYMQSNNNDFVPHNEYELSFYLVQGLINLDTETEGEEEISNSLSIINTSLFDFIF